jgi:hypothetical protein
MITTESGTNPLEAYAKWKAPGQSKESEENHDSKGMDVPDADFPGALEDMVAKYGQGWVGDRVPLGHTDPVFPFQVPREGIKAMNKFFRQNGFRVTLEKTGTASNNTNFPTKNEVRISFIKGQYGAPDIYFYRAGEKESSQATDRPAA